MSTFAFVGPPGSGKTTMACSACELGYSVHIVDTDRKLVDMANIQQYLDSGLLTYWMPKSPLVKESIAERAKTKMTDSKGNIVFSYPKQQPEGFIEIAEYINTLDDGSVKSDIIVLDSFTRLCDHLKRFMLHIGKRAHFEYSDWDSWFLQLNEVTDAVLSLPFTHKIICYHDKILRDELTGQIRMPVAVDGQYSDAVGRYFSEMYAFETTVKGEKAEYKIRTVNDPKRSARSSYGLEAYMPATFVGILPKKGGGK